MTFTVDSDLNGASPRFTLTCISTGGPATTVTWTRDSLHHAITEGTETVLNDPVTAQYTHTLTVTGRLGGLYTCTVANDKPSNASAQLKIQGILVTVIHKLNFAILSRPFPSLWCERISEWTGQCTSVLDTSIRRTCCDWLHHLLPARQRREALTECRMYEHYCHHHWTD